MNTPSTSRLFIGRTGGGSGILRSPGADSGDSGTKVLQPQRKNSPQNPSNSFDALGGTWKAGIGWMDGEVNDNETGWNGGWSGGRSDIRARTASVGYEYALSQRTTLYAGLGFVQREIEFPMGDDRARYETSRPVSSTASDPPGLPPDKGNPRPGRARAGGSGINVYGRAKTLRPPRQPPGRDLTRSPPPRSGCARRNASCRLRWWGSCGRRSP